MDDMPVTSLSCGAKSRFEPLATAFSLRDCRHYPTAALRVPKHVQELLDEVAGPPTLRERMENWGSD